MKLDEKALEAAWETLPHGSTLISTKAFKMAISTYLSAVPSSPVSELVEALLEWSKPDTGSHDAGVQLVCELAATTLTTLSTRNAELEREVKRLREAVDLLETANSLRRNSMGDVNYDTFYDGPSVEDLEERAHALSTSPQGGEHGE